MIVCDRLLFAEFEFAVPQKQNLAAINGVRIRACWRQRRDQQDDAAGKVEVAIVVVFDRWLAATDGCIGVLFHGGRRQ